MLLCNSLPLWCDFSRIFEIPLIKKLEEGMLKV